MESVEICLAVFMKTIVEKGNRFDMPLSSTFFTPFVYLCPRLPLEIANESVLQIRNPMRTLQAGTLGNSAAMQASFGMKAPFGD
jgi:hypothetical protein